MPGKKKKGGKKGGKGKGGGGDGGLPPPPDFSDSRQSALEALYAYRITGKKDVIDIFAEEAESMKDRNYQQKQKNYSINQEKGRHLETLIEEAKEFEKKISQSETVGREDVEKAMLDKLDMVRKARQDIANLVTAIDEEDKKLDYAYKELSRLRDYKDRVQHERKNYIASMKEAMVSWKKAEKNIEEELTKELEVSKARVDQRLSLLAEMQKEKVSERLLLTMDSSAIGEISDNSWLKQQISFLQDMEKKLQSDVDNLERRNLEVMGRIYHTQHIELETAQKLFSIPGNHSTLIDSSSSDALSRNPSTNKLFSRQLDLGLLSVEGNTFNLRPVPEHIRLPPILEQRNQSVPAQTWPVTGKMLKAIT
ncbi:PREDICTED: structural maintenance of chromosomes protein 1A-like [Amphimedon queenslandica]|uniref:Uncharacterized protein n=1 Tax=Amphimedon queenslandica TaxID=400682 RepID=A0A1X7UZX9_AMPQE|nr:PREDICTED: structural maintenance of chromosomes protein 1A-like [Amphimedon queenslandica]|eukprot:XP_003386279.1 PREDICTED: structural maintenance of chromosomes protein 1A-like [Amphimedon queenslandica]